MAGGVGGKSGSAAGTEERTPPISAQMRTTSRHVKEQAQIKSPRSPSSARDELIVEREDLRIPAQNLWREFSWSYTTPGYQNAQEGTFLNEVP
jgi:hypothetical protein